MSFVRFNFPFSGGIDRSKAPQRSDPGTFFDLFNFRHSNRESGVLEQTPYFYQNSQLNQGTYYNGGSLTEPTASKVRRWDNDKSYYITDYVVWNGASQMQVFYQTAYPTAENVNTGCLLTIASVAGLAITLGSTLDVVIEIGGATFKWRKNGGAYTTGLPCSTSGTSIDGGNATVYFLAASGFTAADTWTWTRTDASFETLANVTSATTGPVQSYNYNSTFYFLSIDKRGMVVKLAGATPYAISMGYRPVYGRSITVFEDHIVLGGFSKTAGAGNWQNLVVGWSDNITAENFISTDTNEADQKTLPGVFDSTSDWVISVGVVQQQLFVFTLKAIYYSSYLGLPDVFSFKQFLKFDILNYLYPVIYGNEGAYIINGPSLYFFNGAGLQYLGTPFSTRTIASTNAFATVFGVFVERTKELVIIDGGSSVMYVLQALTGRWYRRSVDFDATTAPTSVWVSGDDLYIGSGSRKVLTDATTQWTISQPVFDYGSGAAYATPKITTQVIAGFLSVVKEMQGVYLIAKVTSASSTYYSTDANLQFKLYWYNTPSGQIAGVSASTDTNATWVNTKPDGMISYPRVSFRAMALEVQLVGLTANKPPAQAFVYGLEPYIKNLEQKEVER